MKMDGAPVGLEVLSMTKGLRLSGSSKGKGQGNVWQKSLRQMGCDST